MINLVFARLRQDREPSARARAARALWAGFPVRTAPTRRVTRSSSTTRLADRWILTQFTTGAGRPTLPLQLRRGLDDRRPDRHVLPLRFSRTRACNFPDYPKYGVWTDSYVLTTREFGPTVEYGIGVYALEKNKMVNGEPNARAVQLLPRRERHRACCRWSATACCRPTSTASKSRKTDAAIPIVGTQDDDGAVRRDVRRAEHLGPLREVALDPDRVARADDAAAGRRRSTRTSRARPTSRDCLPQPGITDPDQYLDILSYRQRPTWRLAYRNFKDYEALVTNQSVEALPGVAGRALVRDPARRPGVLRLPAGHVRPGRRRPPLDGRDRQDKNGDIRARLQRRQRHERVPGHPLHRAASPATRSAR